MGEQNCTRTAGPVIVWFRRDLRLQDNPALQQASREGRPVIPVYIHDPGREAPWTPGAASLVWLHDSLGSLGGTIEKAGGRLLIREGETGSVLADIARESGAAGVYWNRRSEPHIAKADAALAATLRGHSLEVGMFDEALLFSPDTLRTRQGGPYRVFTPFYRACMEAEPPSAPAGTVSVAWHRDAPGGIEPASLGLRPSIPWDAGIRDAWSPGRKGAQSTLKEFLGSNVGDYHEGRDRIGAAGTSRLSPYLHFGEISIREAWQALDKAEGRVPAKGLEAFRRQLVWREFARHVLHHFPETESAPMDPSFLGFRWREDPEGLAAWQQGRTGFPIVDAGMRELWATGWMHNRVRMITASFLTKDLLVSWTEGARWFWDTLVDADLANNTMGWQWTAGCGVDAAPFFRVFNPVSQGKKFDADGTYVRRWVPELKALPAKWIHEPYAAPDPVLKEAGVHLGTDYPHPVIDHAAARNRALMIYEQRKKT